jgi:hypothetical protein
VVARIAPHRRDDGRMLGLFRHDADGNVRMSAWGWLLIALAMVFCVAVAVGVWRMFSGDIER